MVVLFGLGLFLVFTWDSGVNDNNTNDRDATTVETVRRTDVALSFSYPSGENGFILVESGTDSSPELLRAFLLTPTTDYREFAGATTSGEMPATVSLFVYSLPEDSPTTTMSTSTVFVTSSPPLLGATSSATGTIAEASRLDRLAQWANERTSLTLYQSAREAPQQVEIDGVDALYYTADGLYQHDIYLASYQGRAYLFIGQYDSISDFTYREFQKLLTTISFD